MPIPGDGAGGTTGRLLYGGNESAYVLPGGDNKFPVYNAAGGNQVTNLVTAVISAGAFVPGRPQTVVKVGKNRYWAFFGPPNYTSALWVPGGWQITGLDGSSAPIYGPDWTADPVRIDPVGTSGTGNSTDFFIDPAGFVEFA